MAVVNAPRYDPTLPVLEAFLNKIGSEIIFATANSLNGVALEFQNYQRTYQRLAFTIRKKQFFDFAIKFRTKGEDKAVKKRLRSVVWIDDSVRRQQGFGAARRPDIWARMQYERVRKPKSGNKAIAIPTGEVQKTGSDLIKKKEYPNQLKRSFVVPFKSGDAGIFQRIGRRQRAFQRVERSANFGKGSRIPLSQDPNVRFLYVLKRRAPLDPQFNFRENAEFVFRRRWPGIWERELIRAFSRTKFRKTGFR